MISGTAKKNIVLLDPNMTCSKDWGKHIKDLVDSRAFVDFSQGLDITAMTPGKCDDLNALKYKRIHFAWDRPHEKNEAKFEMVMNLLKGANRSKISAYVLTNAGSTHEQDVYRVETLKSLGIQPYVMVYRKNTAPKITRQLARYANNPTVCWPVDSFDDYKKGGI